MQQLVHHCFQIRSKLVSAVHTAHDNVAKDRAPGVAVKEARLPSIRSAGSSESILWEAGTLVGVGYFEQYICVCRAHQTDPLVRCPYFSTCLTSA